MAVIDTAGAGAFTVAAGQAAIQVQLGFAGRRHALQHLLHQVNAAAWAVQLVAQELVSWAGSRAKAAMHTLAQNRLGGITIWRVFEFWGEIGLHGYDWIIFVTY